MESIFQHPARSCCHVAVTRPATLCHFATPLCSAVLLHRWTGHGVNAVAFAAMRLTPAPRSGPPRETNACVHWRRPTNCTLASRRPPSSGTRSERALGVFVGIAVEQGSDHSLIRNFRLRGMRLEEIDTFLAERDSDLDSILPQDELIRRRQEVLHDLDATERLICVFSSVLHRVSCLCASTRHR